MVDKITLGEKRNTLVTTRYDFPIDYKHKGIDYTIIGHVHSTGIQQLPTQASMTFSVPGPIVGVKKNVDFHYNISPKGREFSYSYENEGITQDTYPPKFEDAPLIVAQRFLRKIAPIIRDALPKDSLEHALMNYTPKKSKI